MIEIRSLKIEADIDALLKLSREFFYEYEAHHEDFFKVDNLRDEHIIGYFSSFYERDFRGAYVAVENGQVVGYITCYVKDQPDYWKTRRVGEISGLMVTRAFRHRGIGRKLLEKAIDFFKAQGARYYTVYTAVENLEAIEFYQKNGLDPLYTTLLGEI